ncbi:uncharacterized protein LOC108110576 [Drosophila eugracilis]|uniref:uncharacterized protein LOC108110576 n=1 Tax=Drosophila eugracilis TaxID=29029 RepID=UPI001BD9AFAD|nr:uncharacterized protein LOC108110576 [Drosophila eugracilis]
MRELQILATFSIVILILLGLADSKPGSKYVNDFMFPKEEQRSIPIWEQISKSKYVKSLDKCRDFQLDSLGNPRLTFISYNKFEDPHNLLNKALKEDLKLPELVFSIKVVRSQKQLLVFELPSAIDALLTLNRFCNLYHDQPFRTYEILNDES